MKFLEEILRSQGYFWEKNPGGRGQLARVWKLVGNAEFNMFRIPEEQDNFYVYNH